MKDEVAVHVARLAIGNEVVDHCCGTFHAFCELIELLSKLTGDMVTKACCAERLNTLNPGTRLGWINLLCATLLMYGLGRIHGKKEALEKERELHE